MASDSIFRRAIDYGVTRRAAQGPLYRGRTFDLRLIIDPTRPSRWSASQMAQQAFAKVATSLGRLDAMGFRPRSYLHVLVVQDPNVLVSRGPDGDWIEDGRQPHLIPGGFKLYGVRAGAEVRTIVGNPDPDLAGSSFVLLTDFGFVDMEDLHSVGSDVAVAHEIAHTTDPHLTVGWREARADLLAYLMTGQWEVTLPRPILVPAGFGPDGFVYEPSTRVRSLAHPRPATISQIIPHHESEHANAMIFSSALFELSKDYGRKALIGLIHHLDRNECPFAEIDAETPLDVVRRAYHDHLDCLAHHTRAFAAEHGLDGVDLILHSHGL